MNKTAAQITDEEMVVYRASVLDTPGAEFEIDLVDIETASPRLQQELDRDGIEL